MPILMVSLFRKLSWVPLCLLALVLMISYSVAYATKAREAVFRAFIAGLERHGALVEDVDVKNRTIGVVDLTGSCLDAASLPAFLKSIGGWRIDRLIVGTSFDNNTVRRLQAAFNIGAVEFAGRGVHEEEGRSRNVRPSGQQRDEP